MASDDRLISRVGTIRLDGPATVETLLLLAYHALAVHERQGDGAHRGRHPRDVLPQELARAITDQIESGVDADELMTWLSTQVPRFFPDADS